MRAVLFDVDGVLLDSYAGYREVWSRWCALREVDLELAWAATHGRRPVETVAEATERVATPTSLRLSLIAARQSAFSSGRMTQWSG